MSAPSKPSTATMPERPSHARYWVVVFAITLAILAYIDRVCISMAAPVISRDLGLSKVQMGYIFSAFGIAYAAYEIPGGWMCDLMGARKVLMRIVIWWSAFTAATGFMWNFTSMWVARFLFGAGEAGCFPSLTKAFSTWLPAGERVRAQGVMWTFARWGGAITPPLVIFVFSYMSWRWAFVVFGSLGVFWAAAFYWWFRDDPANHKSVNREELTLITESRSAAADHGPISGRKLFLGLLAPIPAVPAIQMILWGGIWMAYGFALAGLYAFLLYRVSQRRKKAEARAQDVPWDKLLSSPTVWLLWLQYFLLSYPWYFYITWLPTYLQEHRKLSPEDTSELAILPLLFGGFGSMFCGFISARVVQWTGSVTLTRRLMACLGFGGAAVMMVISIQTQDPTYAMIFMGLASFCNDLVMPGAWATCMDIGGEYAGTVAGSMNMMGNVAGFVAPTMGGYIVQSTGNWHYFLYTMAGMYLLGTFVWPFIDPVTRIDQRPAKR
jgi:sugar phosphate permease